MIYHIKKKYETLLASSKQVNSIVTLQQYIRKKKIFLTVYLYQFTFIIADGIKDNGNLVKSTLKTVNPQFDLNRNKMITSTKRFYKQQEIVLNCSVFYNINPK